ncbi:MAG TPA: TlpA disulfide reductase family protein [Thermodesulfobacteriota bacterium]|nr:TlpA disulfide reductase family protein [Thermodesulfobacteriota bacterium]
MNTPSTKNKGLSSKAAIAVVVAIIVSVVLLIIAGQRHKFEPVLEGKTAPDFTLPQIGSLGGKMVKLSDYKGKVVFVNFWATWCKPCEEEMPSMQVMYVALKKQYPNFEILAVSIDKGDPDIVESFAKKYEVTFPILHDRNGKIKEIYKTTGVPETFIIDQNGIIAEKVWGPRDWSKHGSIRTIVELLTNGPSTADKYSRKR